MTEMTSNTTQFKNKECPFTELFSLLKRYEVLSNNSSILAYATEELKAMHQHAENAVEVLLQGLQDVGQLLSVVIQDKKKVANALNNIGYLISLISNLTEALNILRLDADLNLKQRGEVDF